MGKPIFDGTIIRTVELAKNRSQPLQTPVMTTAFMFRGLVLEDLL